MIVPGLFEPLVTKPLEHAPARRATETQAATPRPFALKNHLPIFDTPDRTNPRRPGQDRNDNHSYLGGATPRLSVCLAIGAMRPAPRIVGRKLRLMASTSCNGRW